MKLTFYVLTTKFTFPREIRLNLHEHLSKNWKQYCGNAVRGGDLLSYWRSQNEFYLDFDGALPVVAEFPDDVILSAANDPRWNLFTMSAADFEKTVKTELALEDLIDKFILHFIPDISLSNLVRENKYDLTTYTSLPQKHNGFVSLLQLFMTAYRTVIVNELIGKTIGREHPTKINADNKFDHILLFARPDYMRNFN
ncbi:MAG: hypothetical protein HC836_22665 [Richelia sp. RM2_1_2]|nr:hypothetical protein [Richelia sp. RM2_1_2]